MLNTHNKVEQCHTFLVFEEWRIVSSSYSANFGRIFKVKSIVYKEIRIYRGRGREGFDDADYQSQDNLTLEERTPHLSGRVK